MYLKALAVQVLGADSDLHRALDQTHTAARHGGGPPGRTVRRSFRLSRVYQLKDMRPLALRDVRLQPEHRPAQHAHLGRGKPDAVRLHKRVAHVVKQRVQPAIEKFVTSRQCL